MGYPASRGTPRVKPPVELPLELIRTNQTHQRTDQHLGDQAQQLTRIIVIDQGIKGLKIAHANTPG